MKKKLAVIGSTLAAVLVAGTMAVPAFAASNPADDAGSYSYNTGRSSYTAVQEEYGYSDSDTITNEAYSFNTGRKNAQNRGSLFSGLAEDMTKEEAEAFFAENGLGKGSAYVDGAYDESAKINYGYNTGYARYQQWHSTFENN
ncbi:MAG: hypothetical protein Q4E57_01925 [Eubacteriales bacterium]|nr:hypothetical protein [Eubacteriales bacterium]